jgi:hypothetical protein
MVTAFRLTDKTISIDGVLFDKTSTGEYRASNPAYKNLNVFNQFIDIFLKREQVSNQMRFSRSIDCLLEDLNIPYRKN